MYNKQKNIKATLFVISLLLIAYMLLGQYDIYNYIEYGMSEHKEQINLYKEELLEIHKEISDIKVELDSAKNELSELKKELSEVKDDIEDLYKKYKNLPYTNGPTNTYGELYAGRLYIPSANISVALYLSPKQYITDRIDSANLYAYYIGHNIIADHSNQAFSNLHKVKVGTTGYIKFKDGSVDNIKCVDVFSGHNVVKDIVDKNGNSVINKEDYLMYTCENGWRNILICLWEVV